jgi:hypothetical protein
LIFLMCGGSLSSALTLSGNWFQVSTILTAKELFLISVLANCLSGPPVVYWPAWIGPATE